MVTAESKTDMKVKFARPKTAPSSDQLAAAERHIAEQVASYRASVEEGETHLQDILRRWEEITPQQLIQQTQQRRRDERARDLRRTVAYRRDRFARLIHDRGVRYANCRLGNFECRTDEQRAVLAQVREYDRDLPGRCAAGQGLLLFGSVGTGKDHILAGLARRAILHHDMCVVWASGAAMERLWRRQMRGDDIEANRTINGWLEADILVISDPAPAGVLTPFQLSALTELLDRRYSDVLPTWSSVNATGRQGMEETLGPRLVDRLRDGALAIKMCWESHRRSYEVGAPRLDRRRVSRLAPSLMQ